MRSGRLLNSPTPYTWNAVLGGRSQLNFLCIRALLFCPYSSTGIWQWSITAIIANQQRQVDAVRLRRQAADQYLRTLLPVRWNFSYELLTFRLGFKTLNLAQNGVFEFTLIKVECYQSVALLSEQVAGVAASSPGLK